MQSNRDLRFGMFRIKAKRFGSLTEAQFNSMSHLVVGTSKSLNPNKKVSKN